MVRPQHCVFVPLAEAVGRQGGVGLLADKVAVINGAG